MRTLALLVFVVAAGHGAASEPTPQKDQDQADGYLVVVCRLQDSRAMKVERIREEQHYAKELGGVVSMRKLYNLQNEIRGTDAAIGVAKRLIKESGGTRTTCREGHVWTILNCIRHNEGEPGADESKADVCDDPSMVSMLSWVRDAIWRINNDPAVIAVDNDQNVE